VNAPSPILPKPGPGAKFAPDMLSGETQQTAAEAVQELGALDLFQGHIVVFLIAFLVTLLTTPLMRRVAVWANVVDRPTDPRKAHARNVAYLGGVAVGLGLFAATIASIVLHPSFPLVGSHEIRQPELPWSILVGMGFILLAGFLDDCFGLNPTLKIAAQLASAGFLAMTEVGTRVAAGVLTPIGRLLGNADLIYTIPLPDLLPFVDPGMTLPINLVYWTGVAIIAIFIVGACNASNLIDGLDGLCSGATAITASALLVIALFLGVDNDGSLDTVRIVMAMALLGACLGFLPHNFKPATIFLGDAGSMLLGYTTIVIILTLGDTGKTDLVVAGLIAYMIPIIDTTLAIVRRKLSGRRMSEADDQHLHHLLKRALGVRGAVLTLYGIGAAFGITAVIVTFGRARVAYTLALVFASYIGVVAVKSARQKIIEEQAARAGLPRAKARPVPPTTERARASEESEPATLPT